MNEGSKINIERVVKAVIEHPNLSYYEIAIMLKIVKSGASKDTSSAKISRMLRTEYAQRLMSELRGDIYTPEKLKKKLNSVLESPDSQDVLLKAIKIGMQEQGMLTEKIVTELYDKTSLDELRKQAAEEAIQEFNKKAMECKK